MNVLDRSRRAIHLAAVACLSTALCLAATSPTAGAEAQAGWARFGHFAPTAAPVDVSVDGKPFARSIAFKDVSDYASLPAGPHHFELRAAGQPQSAPLLAIDAEVPTDQSITIGALAGASGLTSEVFEDALTQPPAGSSLVRFIHAAPSAGAVDVRLSTGAVVASDISYLTATPYGVVPPGQYDVDVVRSGTSDVLLHISGWSIAMGVQSSIIVVEGIDGRLDVAPVQDSAGAAVRPLGGVQTGYGGMAPHAGGGSDARTTATVAGVAMAAALPAVVRRRRRQGRPTA